MNLCFPHKGKHFFYLQLNLLRGDSSELRRLKPDPLNLLVNTGVGKRNIDFKDACQSAASFFM